MSRRKGTPRGRRPDGSRIEVAEYMFARREWANIKQLTIATHHHHDTVRRVVYALWDHGMVEAIPSPTKGTASFYFRVVADAEFNDDVRALL